MGEYVVGLKVEGARVGVSVVGAYDDGQTVVGDKVVG